MAGVEADLVPASPSRAAGGDAVVHHQRLMVAEVAVGQAIHQPVGQRIQLVGGPTLRDAGAPAARLGVRRYGDAGGACERGVSGRGEVYVELPERQRGGRVQGEDVVWRAGWGQGCAVERGRQQPSKARTDVEALLGSRLPSDHLRTVISAGLTTSEGVAVEHVESEVVGVGPNADLGIVRKVAVLERVAVVAPGRVAGGGDRHAL